MFGTWIGRIVKTYDYINRIVLTLPLSVYEGMWKTLSPLVAMHLLDRSCVSVGFFLKLHATFPNRNDFHSLSILCRGQAMSLTQFHTL